MAAALTSHQKTYLLHSIRACNITFTLCLHSLLVQFRTIVSLYVGLDMSSGSRVSQDDWLAVPVTEMNAACDSVSGVWMLPDIL